MRELIAVGIIGIGIGIFFASLIDAKQSQVRPCIEAKAKGYELEQCRDVL